MSRPPRLDCVVVGYNEPPFPRFERQVRRFGAESTAYRELRFSFVDLDGEPHTYLDLLNRVERRARERAGLPPGDEHRCGGIPNLAAVYLASYLGRRGHRAAYVNLFQHEGDRLRSLLDEDPACVAVTTTFYVTNEPAAEIVAAVRRLRPGVPVVVGGPLVANHARRFTGAQLEVALEGIGADIYVVEAQGEQTLERVVRALREGTPLDAVPNLLLAGRAGLRRTATLPEANSVDDEWIDWGAAVPPGDEPTLQTRTARSCAFNCAFCAYPTRAGKLTLASIDTVERELDSMVARGGVKNVVFIDDTFNVPLRRFKELCRRLIARRYPFRWYSYFRCNNSDEEAVDLLAESGCAGVFLGFESGAQSILDAMNKAAKVAQYRAGVEALRRRGVLTFGSFIFGFPGETDATVRETIDFIRSIGLDYYRIQPWYCEPGTPVHDRRDELGVRGTGFAWRHPTMDAPGAMRHIEAAFAEIRESTWLPQWSFDFWILPYLDGRGVPAGPLRAWMALAHRMLALEIERADPARKRTAQAALLDAMTDVAATWCAAPGREPIAAAPSPR